LTKSGNETYGKLTEIIYAVGEICGCNVEDIIETLDLIADKEV
jgi:hypothetical protein